jgi:serine/threonine protein kinase
MGTDSPIETQRTLGKYTLIEKLGEGYLGPVYRGFNQETGCPVAIRIFCDGIKWEPDVEDLFRRECQSVMGTQHPNIASIFDIGKEGQFYYIVMESLGTRNLNHLIAQKFAMPVEAKLSIMIQTAEGLNYAHKRGLLHHNLEPSKIHIAADGTAKIRDFALAHVLRNHLPRPMVRWGAPIYISPEQIENKNCDERSDIFSIGTIFYEFLTFLHPFHDPNSNKALDNILLTAQIPTFEQFPDLPPGIWSLLKTCLAKEPTDRYGSMDDLVTACKELLTSLEEDNQLMIAELYAALAPLRKAAIQPGISSKILQLMDAIQKLAKNETGANYTYLNSLMTDLLEQYPAILAAADAPGLLHAQSFPAPSEISFQAPIDLSLIEKPAEAQASLEPIKIDPPHTESVRIKGEPSPTVPVIPENAPATPLSMLPSSNTVLPKQNLEAPEIETETTPPTPVSRYRRIPLRSYRTAAVLLSILVLALAGYIAWGMEAPVAIQKAWQHFMANSQNSLREFIHSPSSTAAASEGKKTPSIQPSAGTQSDPTLSPNKTLDSNVENPAEDVGSKKLFARVSSLINSGMLRPARIELERLQEIYPDAPELVRLKKQLNSRSAKEIQEQTLKDAEQQKALRRQKEEEWNRQILDLFANGKYDEARSVISTWQRENPGSPQAQEIAVKIENIQRDLKSYALAMSENRYQDALNVLHSVEINNPEDPNLAGLRKQGESRKANARATLTVLRLGAKGSLKLDGRPIGKDGEIENEMLPIGKHILTVQTESGLVASRSQEYLDGQRTTMVYDLAKLQLRPISESDRELLAQRNLLEQVHSFEAEHSHGALRGSCHGTLSMDYYDISYKPSSGDHGFRLPFKLLKLGKIEGKSIELLYVADNQRFHIFKLQDDRSMERFKQAWSELKSAFASSKS